MRKSQAVWIDGIIGGLFGFFVLHLLAMWVVGFHELAPPQREGLLLHMVSPMSLYFAAIGIGCGLLSGWFRHKVIRQNTLLLGQKNRLHKLVAEKDTLLRVLTHDLSNSVGHSSLLLQLAIEPDERGRIEPSLEDLQVASRALQQGVELIKFTRTLLAIESGKIEVPLAPYDLVALLEETMVVFRRQTADKQIVVDFRSPGRPVIAQVEPVTFKNCIVNNLLSNAAKFSCAGSTIAVEVEERQGTAVVSVTNSAEISADRVGRLMDPSGPTSTPGTAGEPGTGFGLPLARKFAEMMLGSLDIRTHAPPGCTTVTVYLPVAPRQGLGATTAPSLELRPWLGMKLA